MKRKYILLGIFLGLIAWILFGCSSSKKFKSTSTSSVDSTHISTSSSTIKKDSSATKRMDSSGVTVKDQNNTYEKETVYEFDTTGTTDFVPSNGTASDYISKQKIRRIVIKEKGQTISKETNQSSKATDEINSVNTSESSIKKDSASLKKDQKEVVKNKTSFNFLNLLWLLLIAVGGYAYYKLKSK